MRKVVRNISRSSLLIPFFLIICVLVAFFLRLYHLDTNLFFGPEQGRDMLQIRNIVLNHKLTLIGSKTDIDGIFHGPLYYYLAAIPFFLTKGNPYGIAVFFITLYSLGTVLMYFLAKELFRKISIALIAVVLYSVSFEMIVYSRWLINVPLSLLFSMVFFYCLHRFLQSSRWNLVGVMGSYVLLGHSEFLNYIVFLVILIVTAFIFREKIAKKNWLICLGIVVVGLVVSVIHYIVFDLRHSFLITNAIIRLLLGYGGGETASLLATIGSIWNIFLYEWENIVGVPNTIVACIVAVICFFLFITSQKQKKNLFGKKLLIITIMSYIFVFTIARHIVLNQFFIGLIPVLLLMVAVALDRVITKNIFIGVILIVAFIFLNIFLLNASIPENKRVFFQTPQPLLKYEDELKIIHWVYKDTAGQPFSIQAFTIPYFWQDGWIYLFWYIGSQTYHQTPEPSNPKLYVIVQEVKSKQFFNDWYTNTINGWGEKVKSFSSGIISVELRILKSDLLQ